MSVFEKVKSDFAPLSQEQTVLLYICYMACDRMHMFERFGLTPDIFNVTF